MAGITSTKVVKNSNGLGPKTRIINLAKTNLTQAELDAAIRYLAAGDAASGGAFGLGANDAHTVVAVSCLTESGVFTPGTTDNVQVSIQGTGGFTAAADFGIGSTGVTSSLLADFDGSI
jgi:hypothetical protein